MFMRVNSKCAHQVRPPLAEQSTCIGPFFATSEGVADVARANGPSSPGESPFATPTLGGVRLNMLMLNMS